MTLKARLERLEQKKASLGVTPYRVFIRQVGEVATEPEHYPENTITVDSLGPDDWVNACNSDITGLT